MVNYKTVIMDRLGLSWLEKHSYGIGRSVIMGKRVLKKAFAMLLCAVMVVALLPAGGLAAEGETHYIAVASDRHTNTTAISSAMGSMPASVEYVCLGH